MRAKTPEPRQRVVVGRVAGAHALAGELRVRYFGDGPGNLLQLSEVWLGRSASDPGLRRFEIVGRGSGRAGEVRIALSGVDDREAASQLRGSLVLADAELLPPLPDGEFYWHEFVGCRVFDRQGREIGTVRELWETGAHDVLVVEGADGQRHLLPTAQELMPEVDLRARRIVVEVLPGLLDQPLGGRKGPPA